MKRPDRYCALTVLILCAAAPGTFAQHYYSGGRQIALTAVEGRHAVETASGVDEAALAHSLGSNFSIVESLSRDFYVIEAAHGLKGSQAEALLDGNASVARHHPDYHVGSSAMGFTVTDYVRAGFGPGVTGAQVTQLNAQYGATTVDSETFADGTAVYTLRVPAGGSYTTLEVANAYYASPLTQWSKPDAHVDFALHRDPAFGPGVLSPVVAKVVNSSGGIDDSLYFEQWHLENSGQLGTPAGVDINAEPAWGYHDRERLGNSRRLG